MKAKNLCKAVALLFAAAVLVLFFFDFVQIKSADGNVTLTGAEMAWTSVQNVAGKEVRFARSSYYLFAFLTAAAAAVFAGLSFKMPRSGVASLVFSAITAVTAVVFLFNKHVDTRPLTGVSSVEFTTLYYVFAGVAVAALLVIAAMLLVIDRIESKAAGKPTVRERVVRFLRDNAAELRKIVWPSGKTVVRGTVVVVVMCAVAAAYVCLLDFGLARLLALILGN